MRAARYLLLGIALAFTACQDVTEPTASDSFQAARQPAQSQEGLDQSELARAVPAFGGFFFDESGRPTVYLTDRSQERALRARIGTLEGMRGHAAAELVIREGQFPYARLEAAFARALHAAMPLAGTVFTDLDEARNRIVVGVEHAGLVAGARAALARAGLAAESYDVVVTPPIQQVLTLRDRFASTQGGIQLHFSRWLCTLGANVLDGSEESFITNSHCTARQGGVESTAYYQPTSSVDGTVIAVEVEDPVYFKGGDCPKGRSCRWSDASRARYSGARGSLGTIATTSGPNNGSITVTGSSNLSGKANVSVGTTVNKVGRTTGWTQGAVSRTCVATGVSGSNILLLCQHWVEHKTAAIVGGGDSGSAVWTTGVALAGLLWGGSSDGKTFIFSPISGIDRELGTLTVK